MRKYSLSIIILVLLLLHLSVPISAFAESDFVNNDFCEEYYWSDISGINLNDNNGFSGVVKYICDEENGEFYLYFSFYDKNLDSHSNEKITIGFTVENEYSKHLICVDENGFTDDSSVDAEDFAQIYYSFEQASAIRKGGTLFVGFKLKNSEDKQAKNYITCDYYFGEYIVHNLLTDVLLDMSKNTQTKKPSANTSAASQNGSESDVKNNNSQKENSKDITDETTKFSGSGKYIQNDSKNEQKYEPEEKSASSNNSYDSSEKYQAQGGEENAETQAQVYNYSSQHSLPSKIMIGVGAGAITLGIICTVAGTRISKKNLTNTNSEEE